MLVEPDATPLAHVYTHGAISPTPPAVRTVRLVVDRSPSSSSRSHTWPSSTPPSVSLSPHLPVTVSEPELLSHRPENETFVEHTK